jgi:hypothetical protein
MNTDYRIRPKKCRHVFHIECMLQWWTEGTCPVCGVSFAPDGQPRLPAAASSEGGGGRLTRSPSHGSTAHPVRGPGGDRASSPGGRRRPGSRSPSPRPLLSRPAGLPGPGTFGGGELAPGVQSNPTL